MQPQLYVDPAATIETSSKIEAFQGSTSDPMSDLEALRGFACGQLLPSCSNRLSSLIMKGLQCNPTAQCMLATAYEFYQ